MKNKKVIISIFIVLVILAIAFMIKGATDSGRKYSVETVENVDYFVLQKDGKYGVIDKTANIVVEPSYENVVIPNPSKAVFICYTENKDIKVLNEKNEEILSNYHDVSAIRLKNIESPFMYEKSVLVYREADKYGLIDFSGKKITEAIYEKIDSLGFKEGELLVEQKGKFGVINIKGTNLVQIKYETIIADGYYTEKDKYDKTGYIVGIKTDEGYRYGYLDVDGNGLLETEYNDVARIVDANEDENIYLLASKNGQYGVYKNRTQLINHEYQSIFYNKNVKLFIVEKSKKYGIVDIEGNKLVDIKYSQIDVSGKYLYAKLKDGTVDVLDVKGNKADITSDEARIEVNDGKYIITIQNIDNKTMYGVLDENAKRLIESKYTYMKYLFEDYFIACNIDGKLGIINSKDETKVDFVYDSIQKLRNCNLLQANVTSENKLVIYSEKLEKISENINSELSYEGEYIKVSNQEKNVYIDKTGKITTSKEIYINSTLFPISQDLKWGFEDKDSQIKVECIYDQVTEFNEYGFAGIMKDGKWGVIDNTGKVVIEPTYELKDTGKPDFLGSYYKVTYGYGECYYTNKN